MTGQKNDFVEKKKTKFLFCPSWSKKECLRNSGGL